MTDQPLKVWLELGDSLLRLRLARPKANIIDASMISALSAALAQHEDSARLKAVILDAEGAHFSFGASVAEHLPDQCAQMLSSLHRLIKQMLDFPTPILVALQGQCLGGGLEVACAGSLLFANPESKLGQPEIKLGVFAPAASCLLPERMGACAAEELLLTGRSIDAQQAYRMGLVNHLAEDPTAAALVWVEKYLTAGSASSQRLAVRAARLGSVERIKSKLDAVEKLYLETLMSTRDAVEGLQAFVEKRTPEWEHR